MQLLPVEQFPLCLIKKVSSQANMKRETEIEHIHEPHCTVERPSDTAHMPISRNIRQWTVFDIRIELWSIQFIVLALSLIQNPHETYRYRSQMASMYPRFDRFLANTSKHWPRHMPTVLADVLVAMAYKDTSSVLVSRLLHWPNWIRKIGPYRDTRSSLFFFCETFKRANGSQMTQVVTLTQNAPVGMFKHWPLFKQGQ